MTFTQRDGGTFTAGWTDNDSGGTVTSIATTGPITGGTITSTGTIGITTASAGTIGAGAVAAGHWNISSLCIWYCDCNKYTNKLSKYVCGNNYRLCFRHYI